MRRRRGRRVNATGRSDGEQYFPVSYPMARSAAWRTLSGPALKIWCELRTRFNGGNNGDLSLSLDEAKRLLGLGKSTAARAFVQLEAHGFIAKTRAGQWYGRLATTWRVTDRGTTGEPPTNDWKRWQPTAHRPATGPRKTEVGPEAGHIAPATVPPRDREPEVCPATGPVSAVSAASNGPVAGHLYNHGLSQAAAPDVKAPLQKAIAKSALGLPHTRPGGSASDLRSALPVGPATEAAMAEKRRAAS